MKEKHNTFHGERILAFKNLSDTIHKIMKSGRFSAMKNEIYDLLMSKKLNADMLTKLPINE
jgi:hypothetical protein